MPTYVKASDSPGLEASPDSTESESEWDEQLREPPEPRGTKQPSQPPQPRGSLARSLASELPGPPPPPEAESASEPPAPPLPWLPSPEALGLPEPPYGSSEYARMVDKEWVAQGLMEPGWQVHTDEESGLHWLNPPNRTMLLRPPPLLYIYLDNMIKW
jgi:hypothetical protein